MYISYFKEIIKYPYIRCHLGRLDFSEERAYRWRLGLNSSLLRKAACEYAEIRHMCAHRDDLRVRQKPRNSSGLANFYCRKAHTDSAREKLVGTLEVERNGVRHELVRGAMLLEESHDLIAARVVRHVEQRTSSMTDIHSTPTPKIFVDCAEVLVQNC